MHTFNPSIISYKLVSKLNAEFNMTGKTRNPCTEVHVELPDKMQHSKRD